MNRTSSNHSPSVSIGFTEEGSKSGIVHSPSKPPSSKNHSFSVETSSGESFNPYAHSPSKPPPSVSLENHSIPTLILRSGIVQTTNSEFSFSECHGYWHSPSKPPSSKNHSIPPLILRSGIAHLYLC